MLTTTLLLPACFAAGLLPQDPEPAAFRPPLRLLAQDQPVRTEAPGYAFPCWADADGDGKPDLVVGQFAGGRIRVHRNLGGGKLAAGAWLQAGGANAEIPGVF